ncbi:MAG: DUF58 domain-containing protein [Polyangiaceae bacterium]|jgi:uncharacterized protein (DUF58 family)|nr:DUF58 domain-containing protein [Polyangiaceae bacterium]
MTDDLLSPDFLQELEALRRRLVVRAASGSAGERRSRRRGSSAEFEDHRPYSTGDDPRRIDWSAYARTGEPVIKLFRAEEDSVVRLLVDASASMRFGEPSKFDAARRFAAALGYMALAGSERAQLLGLREGRLEARPPSRGRVGVGRLLRELGALEASGAGGLASAIDLGLRQAARPGWLVVLSDFFDPGTVTAALGRARAAGHVLGLVQVVAPEEIAPTFEGDLCLVDAETGQSVELSADADALNAYMRRFEALSASLEAFAKRHGATYLRLRSDEPVLPPLRRFVLGTTAGAGRA